MEVENAGRLAPSCDRKACSMVEIGEQSRQPEALKLLDTRLGMDRTLNSSPSASADDGHARGVKPKLEAVI